MIFQHWRTYFNQLIASEISTISRYYNQLIQWKPLAHDTGLVFEAIECASKQKITDQGQFPDLRKEREKRSMILLNGNLNHHLDIQTLLLELKTKLSRTSRVTIVAFNPYLRWVYWLANRWGFRKGEQPFTFVTRTDLHNIAKISGYELVRIRPVGYIPFRIFGIETIINSILPTIPVFKWLSLVTIITLRPVIPEKRKPSLSILIPARNEKGNIEEALKRMPALEKTKVEIIFVEGHSSDGTWDEIQRVLPEYSSQFHKLVAFQQTGKGKGDAVRLGFSHATGELLTILDADLTMPPEMLGKFYDAYCQGQADFINGSRLVYPLEGQAMRFLNRLGNVFFAKMLSAVLETRLGDSLCGTKLFSKHDYQRMIAWRHDFGDFDPFGDFEILFPASILTLGIVDIPVYYRARLYGETQISRFSHGWMLLKMTAIGFLRIKTGRRITQP
ncbi:MAG: glycosyltransferase family 2 protein [SAR324 cluster bacterium]|nr:glycosyltransferase family 2 protein [SAR324 cluster bacterium]